MTVAYLRLRNIVYLLLNKYVGPPYCWAEMYACHVAYCPLVSHGEYADGRDGLTDGPQTVTLRFPLDAASVINN